MKKLDKSYHEEIKIRQKTRINYVNKINNIDNIDKILKKNRLDHTEK